jgi:hypothetical protein
LYVYMARSYLSDSGLGPNVNDNETTRSMEFSDVALAACVAAYIWRRKQSVGICYHFTFILFHLLGCLSKANYLITQIKMCRSFN